MSLVALRKNVAALATEESDNVSRSMSFASPKRRYVQSTDAITGLSFATDPFTGTSHWLLPKEAVVPLSARPDIALLWGPDQCHQLTLPQPAERGAHSASVVHPRAPNSCTTWRRVAATERRLENVNTAMAGLQFVLQKEYAKAEAKGQAPGPAAPLLRAAIAATCGGTPNASRSSLMRCSSSLLHTPAASAGGVDIPDELATESVASFEQFAVRAARRRTACCLAAPAPESLAPAPLPFQALFSSPRIFDLRLHQGAAASAAAGGAAISGVAVHIPTLRAARFPEDAGRIQYHTLLRTKEGMVHKLGRGLFKSWSKRLMELDIRTRTITFFRDASRRKFNTQVYFKSVDHVAAAPGEKRPHCLVINAPSAGKPIIVQLASEQERDEWVSALATYALAECVMERGGLARARMLVECGAAVDVACADGNELPLLGAALMNAAPDVAEFLLMRRASPQCLLRHEFRRLLPTVRHAAPRRARTCSTPHAAPRASLARRTC